MRQHYILENNVSDRTKDISMLGFFENKLKYLKKLQTLKVKAHFSPSGFMFQSTNLLIKVAQSTWNYDSKLCLEYIINSKATTHTTIFCFIRSFWFYLFEDSNIPSENWD